MYIVFLIKYTNAGNVIEIQKLFYVLRLVPNKRLNSDNAQDGTDTLQPEVIHTVYESGSFTPIIQLRRAAKAEPDLADELMAHMQPGMAQDALRGMLTDIGATASMVMRAWETWAWQWMRRTSFRDNSRGLNRLYENSAHKVPKNGDLSSCG